MSDESITTPATPGAVFLYCLFNFEDLKCGAYWGAVLKVKGTYFKSRGIIPMKFKKIVIFSIQITMNNYHYDL